jgi:hypothetical protein
MLTRDNTAPDNIAAKIHPGLGGLLSAASHPAMLADHLSENDQLTVGLGAAPRFRTHLLQVG